MKDFDQNTAKEIRPAEELGQVEATELGPLEMLILEDELQLCTALPCEGVDAPLSEAGQSGAAVAPQKKTLLHACCGPCTLEPARLMQSAGHELTVYFSNANIWPREEYDHRLETLKAWAAEADLPVAEGDYNEKAWAEAIAPPTKAWQVGKAPREERCRACYRQRLQEAAKYAAAEGYEVLATTLAVSPYQHTEIIKEELAKAAAEYGLEAFFEDYRPQYDEATRRSRELGMYRQNYCGCALSMEEAAADRERIKQERKALREAEKAAFAEAHGEELKAAEDARISRKEERKAYDAKQARKRAILAELRAGQKAANP